MVDFTNMTEEQLDKEIVSGRGGLRDAAIQERQTKHLERVLTQAVERLSRPHPLVWWALGVAIGTLIFAGIAAWPVIRSWLQ